MKAKGEIFYFIATKEQVEAFLECLKKRAQKWGNLVAWGVGLATAACVLITTRHPVKGAICLLFRSLLPS